MNQHARASAIAVGVLVLLLAGCQGQPRPSVVASATSGTEPASTASPPPATGAGGTSPADPAASDATRTPPGAPTTTPVASPAPLTGLVIVLDPGHNGANGRHTAEINRQVDAGGFRKPCNSTGAGNATISESELNWQVAQRVAQRLEAAGARVVLTRTSNDGWGPCVDERGKTAQRSRADLLVSLHADGAAAAEDGFHVIYPGRLAGHTETIVAGSRRFAGLLRDALVARGFRTSSYVGTDGLDERTDLGTLNWAGVPCVMLEAGNLHNPGDAALLASAQGQDRIADAVLAAVLAQRAHR